LNSLNWIESSAWDGRWAVAVAGDIAVYEPGPARPTGGAGVVAVLIGPNAPLVVEPGLRSTYMEDGTALHPSPFTRTSTQQSDRFDFGFPSFLPAAYDFYKPNLESEYPVVDGKLSISCYLRALDSCFRDYRARYGAIKGSTFDLLNDAQFACFHSPYTKLVMRSWARLLYQQSIASPANDARFKELAAFRNMAVEQSYTDKELTKVTDNFSKATYEQRVRLCRHLPPLLHASLFGVLF
jgi:hydroxymethylglutaryl-CoA synthase